MIQRNVFLSFEAADPHWANAFLAEMRHHGAELHGLAADPGFVDWQGGDSPLRPDAAARRIGFEPIDLAGVGPAGS